MQKIGDAQLIGATARELLAQPGFAGRVLAVVTGAVYLQENPHPVPPPFAKPGRTGEGEIVWLAQENLPMHTRALRGDFDFSALRVGMRFESDGTALRFGGGDHPGSPLRFAEARGWQPAAIDPARVAPRDVVMARARELKDPKGFAKPLGSLRDLIGLGEGLTPAGDDFVGGVLFARWHLRAAYADASTWDQRAVDDLIEYARTRTNVISHAILRDHARGQSVEPLHDLVAGILGGSAIEEIMPNVRRLLAVGNSTGENLLAGVCAGMEGSWRLEVRD